MTIGRDWRVIEALRLAEAALVAVKDEVRVADASGTAPGRRA